MDYFLLLPDTSIIQILLYLDMKEVYKNILYISKYWSKLIYKLDTNREEDNNDRNNINEIQYYYSTILQIKYSLFDYDTSNEKFISIDDYIKPICNYINKTNFYYLNTLILQNIYSIKLIPIKILNNLTTLTINRCTIDLDSSFFEYLPCTLTKLSVEIDSLLYLPVYESKRYIPLPSKLKYLELNIPYDSNNISIFDALIPPKTLERFIFIDSGSMESNLNSLVIFIESLVLVKELRVCSTGSVTIDRDYILAETCEDIIFECDYFTNNTTFSSRLKYFAASYTDVYLNKFINCKELVKFSCLCCNFYTENGLTLNSNINMPPLSPFLKVLELHGRKIGNECNNLIIPITVEKFTCKDFNIKNLYISTGNVQLINHKCSVVENLYDLDGNQILYRQQNYLKSLNVEPIILKLNEMLKQ